MDAETFLKQIRKIDVMIEGKLAEIDRLESLAYRMSWYGADKEKINSSGNPDKMAEAIASYLDIKNEILADIKNLKEIKKDVISVIEMLNPDEYYIVHQVYVLNNTLGEVAYSRKMSYSWATTTHKRAKANVQKILDERTEKTEN